jgi:hypothetical protein
VSYAWRLTGDARADLRELEPQLQEEVIDQIDALTEAPESMIVDEDDCVVVEVERHSSGMLHLLFIRLHRDDGRELITVLGIGDHAEPEYWE